MDQYSVCYACHQHGATSSTLLFSFCGLALLLVLAAVFSASVKPPVAGEPRGSSDQEDEGADRASRLSFKVGSPVFEARLSLAVAEVGALLPRAICTLKLLLGFTQVVTGSLQALDLDMGEDIRVLLRLFVFNPVQLLSSENRCSHRDSFSFFDELVLFLTFPVALLCVMSGAAGLVCWLRVERSSHAANAAWRASARMDVWNMYFRLILWSALVMFPALSTK